MFGSSQYDYCEHEFLLQLQIWVQSVAESLSLRKREGFWVFSEIGMQARKERIQKEQIFKLSKTEEGKKGLRKD